MREICLIVTGPAVCKFRHEFGEKTHFKIFIECDSIDTVAAIRVPVALTERIARFEISEREYCKVMHVRRVYKCVAAPEIGYYDFYESAGLCDAVQLFDDCKNIAEMLQYIVGVDFGKLIVHKWVWKYV